MVFTAVMGTLLSNSSKVRRSLPVKTQRRSYSSRCREKVHSRSPVLHFFNRSHQNSVWPPCSLQPALTLFPSYL